jgi:hypothetical protein
VLYQNPDQMKDFLDIRLHRLTLPVVLMLAILPSEKVRLGNCTFSRAQTLSTARGHLP